MNRDLQSNNQVSVCYKNACLHSKGKNAEMIAQGATVFLLLAGIGALIKALSN